MKYRLKLYINGETPRGQRAKWELSEFCEQHLKGQCELEVIDVTKDPAAAETDKILATPTLVRVAPSPSRRMIGDFTNMDRVAQTLELKPRG